jgi:DNA-binding response OmpR family regulator
VRTAADGRQAIAVADEFEPGLIILDVTLPVLSNHGVAAHLRELRGETFAVLVITADGQAVEKARRLGAYAYLRKPFDLDHLVEQVWHGLRRTSVD